MFFWNVVWIHVTFCDCNNLCYSGGMSALRDIEPYVDKRRAFVLSKEHPDHAAHRNLFFRMYRQMGTIANTCDTLGLDTKKVRQLQRTDPEFAEGITEAQEDFADTLEGEVYRRAMNGSDLLLMFAVKKHRPLFKENAPQQVNNTFNVKAYIGIDPENIWGEAEPAQKTIEGVVNKQLTENGDEGGTKLTESIIEAQPTRG